MKTKYMFQRDTDPKHTAKIDQRYFKNHLNSLDGGLLKSWNPIGNLWARTCDNEEDLFKVIEEG